MFVSQSSICVCVLVNLHYHACSSGTTWSTEIAPSIPNFSQSTGALGQISWVQKGCHRRSGVLTISEFTSAPAHGQTDHPTAWSPRTKHRRGRRREKEGLRKKEEGANDCCYLLVDSPAKMCWDVTSFYIWCALSCEATCTVSIVSILFIITFVRIWLWGMHTRTEHVCYAQVQRQAFFKWAGCSFFLQSSSVQWTHTARITGKLSASCFQQPQLGLFGSSWHDRIIGLHRSLPVFDNLPHLSCERFGQAAYKSFTGLINCLKSASLSGK